MDDLDERSQSAMAMYDAGNFPAAERAWRALVTDYERSRGRRHPDTIGAYNELGSALFQLRRFGESAEMHREAHRRASTAIGPDDPATSRYAHNLAAALLAGGDIESAIPILQDTVRDRHRALGPGHEDTLESTKTLGVALFMAGDGWGSRQVLGAAHETAVRSLGPSHPITEDIAGNLDIVRRNS